MMTQCDGSYRLTLNGDRVGIATCKVCGRGQLLHVSHAFRTGRTIGRFPQHTVKA